MTPHILVVDDDTRLRELLRQYLAESGFRVTVATDAADARRRLAGLAFDLLVIDVMMPGENGLDLTEALRGASQIPILLLTAMGEVEHRIAGFEHGADDYLVKPFEPRELVLRINTILRRAGPPEQRGRVQLGDYYFDLNRNELLRDNEPIYLTAGEAQLLGIFARNPGVTLSRTELNRLTGGGKERSVDVQITRLRRRIEPDPRAARFLQTVRGEGYVLRPN